MLQSCCLELWIGIIYCFHVSYWHSNGQIINHEINHKVQHKSEPSDGCISQDYWRPRLRPSLHFTQWIFSWSSFEQPICFTLIFLSAFASDFFFRSYYTNSFKHYKYVYKKLSCSAVFGSTLNKCGHETLRVQTAGGNTPVRILKWMICSTERVGEGQRGKGQMSGQSDWLKEESKGGRRRRMKGESDSEDERKQGCMAQGRKERWKTE